MVPASYSLNLNLISPNGRPLPLTAEQRAAAEAAAAASAAASAASAPEPTAAQPVVDQQKLVAPGPGTYYVPTHNANEPYVPIAPKTPASAAPQPTPAPSSPKQFRIIMEPEATQ